MVVVAVVMSVLVVLLTLWGFLGDRPRRPPKPVRPPVVPMTVLVTGIGSSGVEATGAREPDGARFSGNQLVVTGERDKTSVRSVYRIQDVWFDRHAATGPVQVRCTVLSVGDSRLPVVDAFRLGRLEFHLADLRRADVLDGAHATVDPADRQSLLTGVGKPVKVPGPRAARDGRHHLRR